MTTLAAVLALMFLPVVPIAADPADGGGGTSDGGGDAEGGIDGDSDDDTSGGTPIVITRQPVDADVLTCDAATFTAEASGDPTPSVQWERASFGSNAFSAIDVNSEPTADDKTYVTAPKMPGDERLQYRAKFYNPTDVDEFLYSDVVTVHLSQKPIKVLVTLLGAEILVGQALSFALQATGCPTPRWEVVELPDWLTLANNGGGNATVSGTPPTPGMFTVRLRAENPFSQHLSTVSLEVRDLAPVITAQPTPVTVMAGTSAKFNVVATAPSPPTVQWQRAPGGNTNWVDIAGATGLAYETPPTSPNDNGAQFRAIVTNGSASVISNPAILTVQFAPAPPTISAVTSGDAQAVVAFNPGAAGNPPDTSFTVEATPTNGGTAVAPQAAAASPITVTGLTNGASYVFTVRATNSAGLASSSGPSAPVIIGTPPTISGTAPGGMATVPYEYSYQTTGAPAPGVTLAGGNLPPGLTLTPAGKLSGIPTVAGSYTFTVRASNALGTQTSGPNTVVIAAAHADLATTAAASKSSAKVGDTLTYTVTSTNNGPAAARNAVTSLALPRSLTVVGTGNFVKVGQLVVFNSVASHGTNTSRTFTVNVKVTGRDARDPTQSALASTVSLATPDLRPLNNLAAATVTIN